MPRVPRARSVEPSSAATARTRACASSASLDPPKADPPGRGRGAFFHPAGRTPDATPQGRLQAAPAGGRWGSGASSSPCCLRVQLLRQQGSSALRRAATRARAPHRAESLPRPRHRQEVASRRRPFSLSRARIRSVASGAGASGRGSITGLPKMQVLRTRRPQDLTHRL
jgi:hypothetical protein